MGSGLPLRRAYVKLWLRRTLTETSAIRSTKRHFVLRACISANEGRLGEYKINLGRLGIPLF